MQVWSMVLSIITSLTSGMLLFFLQSVVKENRRLKQEKDDARDKRDKAMQNGMVCVLRKHLMDEHETWIIKGYITSHALENGLAMYRAYKDLGGNGMIDHMEEEIQGLPIRD